ASSPVPVKQVRQPAAPDHSHRESQKQQHRVNSARSLAHVQHIIKVIMHPEEKEILKISKGGVTDREQHETSAHKEVELACGFYARNTCLIVNRGKSFIQMRVVGADVA